MRTSAGSTEAAATGRVWFITGASRGLGRAFADAALAAGDVVAVAARTTAPLEELAAAHPGRVLPLRLDVTDRAAVLAAVAAATDHYGRLDIVVNNAGMLTMGMAEEFTEAEARAQLDVNFFGALWVSQAVLPVLRAQGSGHLVQISSIAALAGFPSTGLYSASKFALEGLSEAIAMEAAGFGVKVSIVQPGGYWTDLYSAMRTTTPLDAYAPLRAELEKQFAEGSVDSDPARRRRAAPAGRQRRTAAAPAARRHGLRPRVRPRPAADGDVGRVGEGQPGGRARRPGARPGAARAGHGVGHGDGRRGGAGAGVTPAAPARGRQRPRRERVLPASTAPAAAATTPAAIRPFRDRQDSTDQRELAESSEPRLSQEPAESAESAEPAEPIDSTLPTEPTESTEPTEPIDRAEPIEATERTESSDQSDRDDEDAHRAVMRRSYAVSGESGRLSGAGDACGSPRGASGLPR